MNSFELNRQLLEAAQAVRDSLAELERRSNDWAIAERQYRLAKSKAYLLAEGRNQMERESRAEDAINQLRYQRDVAEGLKVSALEAVRSNRGVLSALQTLANVVREEAAFERTGPDT